MARIFRFIMTIEEINKNQPYLQNVTIGYNIQDDYFNTIGTSEALLDMLSTGDANVPNYSCGRKDNLLALLDAAASDISIQMSTLVGTYKVAQTSYEIVSEALNDKSQFPFFHPMFPKEGIQYPGIVQLLLHFRWTLIGLFASDTENGENFMRTFTRMLLHPFMKKSVFCNISLWKLYVDQNGDIAADLDIVSGVVDPKDYFLKGKLGSFEKKGLFVNQDALQQLTSLNQSFPQSKCVENCHPGFVKQAREGEPVCCYNCIPCPKGTISTQEDVWSDWRLSPDTMAEAKLSEESLLQATGGEPAMIPASLESTKAQLSPPSPSAELQAKKRETDKYPGIVPKASEAEFPFPNVKDTEKCTQCPDDQYPTENRIQCIPKRITFLSYEETLSIILISFALILFLTTGFVSLIFLQYQETPIVKANNRDLSYILLVSLLLCFLSSLFFIGRPRKASCLLRQAVFSIVFSIAVSSVLAKTITVVLAFLASKPGNRMRRWLGKSLANSIILSGSDVQIVICALWLGISPPFPDSDLHSQPGEIILQCNEGSITMFYVVLGNMCFLATICFTVAFLARNLPGAFNEAKLITFSMLVFCSVWVSFLPAYLSTKGKSMVVVQIFSILASSAGVLGCIFFPKCYILLLRPDLNTKEYLMLKVGK
ncbi:vomeronasal type-2 receptor 26-like [Pituophis catenifer annectens]|uniref:vomeronasal type-2 receptor 26-like n=1 Tax=Pituophis catenifer annectens TaxID=94852 RepID=UPI0039938672